MNISYSLPLVIVLFLLLFPLNYFSSFFPVRVVQRASSLFQLMLSARSLFQLGPPGKQLILVRISHSSLSLGHRFQEFLTWVIVIYSWPNVFISSLNPNPRHLQMFFDLSGNFKLSFFSQIVLVPLPSSRDITFCSLFITAQLLLALFSLRFSLYCPAKGLNPQLLSHQMSIV